MPQEAVAFEPDHERAAGTISGFPVDPPDRSCGGADRTPGALKGRIRMAPDFDTLPEEMLAAMEGERE